MARRYRGVGASTGAEGPVQSGTSGLLQKRLPQTTVCAMDQPAGYLHWGFILISWPNLIVIGLMVVLFALALILPFPGHGSAAEKEKKA
jgi:hypothetical protein